MKTLKNLGLVIVVIALITLMGASSKWLWSNKESAILPTLAEVNTLDSIRIDQPVQRQLDNKLDTVSGDARYFKIADGVDGYTAAQVDSILLTKTYTVTIEHPSYTTPLDNTVYYWGSLYATGIGTTAAVHQLTTKGSVKIVGYSVTTRSTAAATTENGTLSVRVNNTTDYLISNTVHFNGAFGVTYESGNLNITLAAGDKWEFKYLTPTWATDASAMMISVTLTILPL